MKRILVFSILLAFSTVFSADSLGVNLLGRFTATSPEDIIIIADRAFIANSSGGLQVLDVSNPATISELGYLFLPGRATGLCELGDNIAVACSDSSLRILDARVPSAINIIGTYRSEWPILRCESRDHTIFTNGGRFLSIDASNPTAPVLLGQLSSVFDYLRLAVSGDFAYLAEKNYGLSIVNIANPALPTAHSRRFALEQYIRGVCVDRWGNIFAAANSGIFALRWQGDTLAQIGHFPTSNPAHDIFVDGRYAFVACGAAGLRILDVSNPSSISEVGFYNLGSECTDLFLDYPTAWVSGLWARVNAMNVASFAHIQSAPLPDATSIKVCPNPFNSAVKIQWSAEIDLETIEIYDIEGRLVHSETLRPCGRFVWCPDMSLCSGVYLFRINTRNGRTIYKNIVLLK